MSKIEVNVCSDSNWHITHSDTVDFKNPHQQDVHIVQYGTNPWPFTPGPPITVPKQGDVTVGISGVAPGSYDYATTGCPNDNAERILTNPKTVIIDN